MTDNYCADVDVARWIEDRLAGMVNLPLTNTMLEIVHVAHCHPFPCPTATTTTEESE